MEAALERLCSKLAKRLKASQLTGATVTLKLKRSDHQIITRSYSLHTPTDKAHKLFDVGRRLLAPETKKRISYRLLGIGVSNLDHVMIRTLFDRNGGFDDKRNRLEAAMDQLQGKLGNRIIQSGRQFCRYQPASDDDDTA